MTDNKPTLSFQLPQGKTIEGYLVKLSDGSHVIRTADELELAPPRAAAAPAPTK